MTIPTLRAEVTRKRTRSHDVAVWFAVAAFVAYVGMALAGGGGRALALTYPAGCLVIGVFAYARSPTTYLAFTWWTWLLTPFIRRVFDLRYGFHPTSTLLLGPLLVTAVAGLTILRRGRMLRSSTYLPFVVAATSLAYAFAIGAIKQPVVAAAYDLLTWLAPLMFGMHLALEWQQFPRIRSVMTTAILAGLLATAAYGIWQFIQPPVWDRAWVINAKFTSVGMPLPFVIRVFSTLNAPGPFSVMLVTSLLIGLASPQRWRAVPLALGLITLILTKGRSAWGALFVGAVVLQLQQPLRNLPRQWIALLAMLLLAAPFITQPRVMNVLTGRASSVKNLQQDESYRTRAKTARRALSLVASNPVGDGLGGFGGAGKLVSKAKAGYAFDNGPLEIYAMMGWIGGTLYLMALAAIVLPIVRGRRVRFEPITSAALATIIALIAASFFGNIFNSTSGFFFWSAVGLATAGRTYALGADIVARYGGVAGLPTRGRTLPPVRTTAA